MRSELAKIADLFNINGNLLSIVDYGSGHIHKTYLSSFEVDGGVKRYIHQAINNKIFTDVEGLMSNIAKVLSHIERKLAGDESYLKIKVTQAKDGKAYAVDPAGQFWRTYNYLENTDFVEFCSNAEQAKEAGRIAGFFQKLLIDIDIKSLKENIRNFTSGPHRIDEFKSAAAKNTGRKSLASAEIEFLENNASVAQLIESRIQSGSIPRRVVHGDTKINNVLFRKNSNIAVCLVDLDTCMPGYSLYDFGDLVRSTSINVAEDEQDFSKIVFGVEFFEAIVKGYLLNASSFLNEEELSVMHLVPQLISFTLGVRFLTDYLNNDVYFKVKHPSHNLDRARTQFKIFEIFRNNQDEMQRIIKANAS